MIDFKTLVHDHHAVLYRIALGILRDSSSAEDAVQEVYLDLLRRPGEAAESRHLRAWLARCVIHRALMQRRAAGRRDRREALCVREVAVDPIREAERRELRVMVEALPEDQRLAVDLHYLRGFSLEEAASALAVSDRTVSARLKAGLERLRAALAGAGFVLLAASLETELSAGEPAPVPAGMEERLLGLPARTGAGRAEGSGGSRVVAVPLAAAILVCLFFLIDRRGRPADAGGPAAAAAGGGEAASAGPDADRGRARASGELDRSSTVRGVVVDARGVPVAGAAVRLEEQELSRLPGTCVARVNGGRPGRATTSGPDGRFSIPAGHGRIDVSVEARGRAPVTLLDCSADDDLRIVLPDARALRVKVAAEDGGPIGGARVVVMPNVHTFATLDLDARLVPTTCDANELMFRAEASTDAAGVASFAGLPDRECALVSVRHPEFVESMVPVALRERDVLEVVLSPGSDIAGRVLDTTGSPVPGATVVCRRMDGDEIGMVLGDSVRSGEDGSFHFRNAPEGRRYFWCRAPGFAPFRGVSNHSPVEIRLERGVSVSGRVVDDCGEPVPGALVGAAALTAQSVQGFSPVQAGADGRFTIPDLPRGLPLRLEATAPGAARVLREFPAQDGEALDAGDIALGTGAILSGRVSFEDGSPAARLELLLTGHADEIWGLPMDGRPWVHRDVAEEAVCDADGRYRFADLAPGPYVLSFRPEGWPNGERPVRIAPGAARESLEIVLDGGWPLNVEAVDDTGAAVAGLELVASCEGGVLRGRTDEHGRLRLRPTGESAWIWVFDRDLYTGLEDLKVRAGSGTARLVLPSPRKISGRVLMADGSPAAAEVKFAQAGFPPPFLSSDAVETGEDGAFEIEVRSAAPVDLHAKVRFPESSRDGGTRSPYACVVVRAGVAPGSTGIELRAPDIAIDGSVTVVVQNPEGAPLAGATVGIDDFGLGDAGLLAEVATDEKGEVRVQGLPRTRLRAWAQLPDGIDGEIGSAELVVVPDGQTITLRLPRQLPVTGRVVDEAGEPCRDLQVVVYAGGEWINSIHTGEDGRFEIWIPQDLRAVQLRVGVESRSEDLGVFDDVDPRAFQNLRVKRPKTSR
ncbi:MAG: sigma-70 family RNA polymerase sigma factor [Planctomycetes bacterium]|nr:sigma-70 family RNA polymerase sigma factor [Planctomycetota bacterium]